MKYNFDKKISRYNTSCYKYDNMQSKDILPMWIADMDVVGCKEIYKEIKKASKNAIFGYSRPCEYYYEYLTKWYKDHFDFVFSKDDVVCTPGVVFALCVAIQTLTNEGDNVIINEPVYHHFRESIEKNNRKCISSDLVLANGKYSIDFSDFENKIKENNVKMFILCSPHNPVGRVWTKEELTKINDICRKYNVKVFSDEIHCDFVFAPSVHTPFMNVSDDVCNYSIVATAPSKTFNIAGLESSNIIIKNEEIRNNYKKKLESLAIHDLNMLGLVGTKAAYKYGLDWHNQFMDYLKGNIECLKDGLKDIPEVKLISLEGTYLAWLDFSTLNLNEKLFDFLLNDCKLFLNDGREFGSISGINFMRMNLATQRANVIEACNRLKKGISKWKEMNA